MTIPFLDLQILDEFQLYGYSAYVLMSLISVGLLFDGHPLASWMEMIRCLVFLGFSIKQPFTIESYWAHTLLFVVRVFHFYSAWIFKKDCIEMFKKMTPLKEKDL